MAQISPCAQRVVAVLIALGLLALIAGSQAEHARASESGAASRSAWWREGEDRRLEAAASYENSYGRLGILNTAGPIDTKGHPFFEPIGTNGRACVTCHQPADGMGLSLKTIRERWDASGGKDPLFAAIDGSNCPSLPQGEASSHSLLLERGLIRVGLPWPPRGRNGKPIEPEFTIEVVRDPASCNTDPVYGLKSANPTVSVYRRPRPAANLKYVVGSNRGIGGRLRFSPKNYAGLLDLDPDTGRPVTMQIMADARQPTLKTQAADAALGHLEVAKPLDERTLEQIVAFEMQLYAAQEFDRTGGSLTEPGGPPALGPRNLSEKPNGVLGDNFDDPVFYDFDAWKKPAAGESREQRAFRESVARGYDIFFLRPFWVRDTMHINTVGLGNPTKRSCATCHNMQMTGMDLVSGWVDLGTTNMPWAEPRLQSQWDKEKPQLPLFKITCREDVPPHMFLGRVIYTHDPGRALISGKCHDVGSVVMQQFRGLAARPPYFVNGSAKDLREIVDFYDRRFSIGYTEQEKVDLVNFMSVL